MTDSRTSKPVVIEIVRRDSPTMPWCVRLVRDHGGPFDLFYSPAPIQIRRPDETEPVSKERINEVLSFLGELMCDFVDREKLDKADMLGSAINLIVDARPADEPTWALWGDGTREMLIELRDWLKSCMPCNAGDCCNDLRAWIDKVDQRIAHHAPRATEPPGALPWLRDESGKPIRQMSRAEFDAMASPEPEHVCDGGWACHFHDVKTAGATPNPWRSVANDPPRPEEGIVLTLSDGAYSCEYADEVNADDFELWMPVPERPFPTKSEGES